MNRRHESQNASDDGNVPEMQSARPRRLMLDNAVIMKALNLNTGAKNENEHSKIVARHETSNYSTTSRQARNETVDSRFPVSGNNPRPSGRPEENRKPYDSRLPANTKQSDRSNYHYDIELERKRHGPPQPRYGPSQSGHAGNDYRSTPKTSTNFNSVPSGPFRGQPERVNNNFEVRNSRVSPNIGQRHFYQNFESGRPAKNIEPFKSVYLPARNTSDAPNDKSLHKDTRKPSPNTEPPHSILFGILKFKSNNKLTAHPENALPVPNAIESKDKETKFSPNDQKKLPVENTPEKREANLSPTINQERQRFDERSTQKINASGTSSPTNKSPHGVKPAELKNAEAGNSTKSPPAKMTPDDEDSQRVVRTPSPRNDSPHSTLFEVLKFKTNNKLAAQPENASTVGTNKQFEKVVDIKPAELEPVKTEVTIDTEHEKKFSPSADQERQKSETVKPAELKNAEAGNSTKSPPAKMTPDDEDSQRVVRTPSPRNDSPHSTLFEVLKFKTNNKLGAQPENASTAGTNKPFQKVADIKPAELEPVKTEVTIDTEHEKTIKQAPKAQNKPGALLQEFHSILDKLTAECFEELVGQVQMMQIDSEEGLRGCAQLIHEAAVMQPHFSETYARFAAKLGYLRASDLTLGNALVERCQDSCEMIIDSMDSSELNKWPISKKISLGNVKFIGELLKVGEISENLVCDYLSELLSRDQDEVSIGCICKLLSTAGKTLESSESMPKLDACFFVLESLMASGMSNGCKLMVEDLINLRQAHWNSSSS